MGMVYQSEEMQREIIENLEKVGKYKVLSTEINATNELSLCILPLTFDVILGDETIVSLNHCENAIIIYRAIMADLKGEVFNG